VAVALPAAIAAAPQWQLKWTFNYTGVGLSAPKWNAPVYADIDGDGIQEILTNPGEERLAVVKGNGQLDWVFPALDQDPLTDVGKYQAIADIDQDGKLDIILGAKDGIYCLNADGTVKWHHVEEDMGYVQGIIIRDINGDGVPEIVSANRALHLLVLDNNGNEILRRTPLPPGRGVDSCPNAWDVDRDGEVEILVENRGKGEGPGAGNTPGTLMVLGPQGTEEWRWTGAVWSDWLHSEPVVADINGDGEYEIVSSLWRLDSGSMGGVIALTFYGTQLWQWQNTLDPDYGYTGATPVVWDIDGDGRFDIVQVCRGGYTVDLDPETGKPLWVFNWSSTSKKNTIGTLLGDFTGDGKLDIVFTTWANCTAFVLDNKGELETMYHIGGSSTVAPVMGDLDGDGKLELVMFSGDTAYCLTLGAPYNAELLPWPMGMKDAKRFAVIPIPEVMLGVPLLSIVGLLYRRR